MNTLCKYTAHQNEAGLLLFKIDKVSELTRAAETLQNYCNKTWTNVYVLKTSWSLPVRWYPMLNSVNKTNDLILNLTPENVTQHSRIERQLHTKEAQHPLKCAK